nr:PREDICTED: uncharacterized protein LOC106706956 [Latimeria chalumnae]|eukprot:XP_014354101.1 PREDICTED: uncharacterized protein LOC106706956 [Latimeria chalumnae]
MEFSYTINGRTMRIWNKYNVDVQEIKELRKLVQYYKELWKKKRHEKLHHFSVLKSNPNSSQHPQFSSKYASSLKAEEGSTNRDLSLSNNQPKYAKAHPGKARMHPNLPQGAENQDLWTNVLESLQWADSAKNEQKGLSIVKH